MPKEQEPAKEPERAFDYQGGYENDEPADSGTKIPENQQEHDEWTPNAAEQQALSGGWRPQSEWEGDPEDWVNAREFNFRGDLMNRISQQGRKLGALEGKLEQAQRLVAASDKVTQKLIADAVAKTKRDLRKQRRDALEEGDHTTVDQIDEELDELKDASAAAAAAPPADATPAAQQREPTPIEAAWFTFVTTTPWAQDPATNQQLMAHANALVERDPHMPVGDFMESVLDKGKEIRGLKRRAAPPGGPDDGKGGSRPKTPRGKAEYTKADLNDQQRAIGQGFVEEGAIDSLDAYAKELGESGSLDRQQRR